MSITIHGPAISTYVRSVRIILEEKSTSYDLVEIDILKGEHKAAPHVNRHPFGLVPSFDHAGFELYETSAILRYVDRVIPNPSFTPSDPKHAARMDQVLAIADSYFYPNAISKLVLQRVVMPMVGQPTDEAQIEAAQPVIATSLAALDALKGDNAFFAGAQPSLADLMLGPVFHYLVATPEGRQAMAPHPRLESWWTVLSARPSFVKTAPKFE